MRHHSASFAAAVATILLGATACSGDGDQTSGDSGGGAVRTSTGNGATSGVGGSGGVVLSGSGGGGASDKDTDGDGIPDSIEGTGDSDGDGKPNYNDPINDGPPPALTLKAISTMFNSPIGIDYHEPTNSVVLSVNYPVGVPVGFERIEFDGSHHAFTNVSGLTDEVKIATARSNNPGGFTPGELFFGNGVDGQIVRASSDGAMVTNPWVDLPGGGNGLMRGGLYVDRTGEFAGNLVVVTDVGEAWRIDANGMPTKLGAVGTHLEGTIVVPNKPARFGPLAGKLIAGAEQQNKIYAFSIDGTYVTYDIPFATEDIDIVSPKENFFGVDFGAGRLLGAEAAQFEAMLGDILLTQEQVTPGTSGLARLKWDGNNVVAEPIPLTPQSEQVGHWEHVTFAPAGINEIPPVPN